MHQSLPAATRSAGNGLLARFSPSLHVPSSCTSSSSIISRTPYFLAFSCKPRTFTGFFANSVAGAAAAASTSSSSSSLSLSSPAASSSTASASCSILSSGGSIFEIGDLPPEARPRMPLVPEDRPKPTTAVTVVEAYLEKLWRDFFTNPHNWFDNRLRRRAPKYADFKNRLTKEGLWITARWNPVWVRTELSLMTHFRPVPYDDPLWAKKKAEEEEARREKPPPVPPGAWLQEELKAKRDRAAATTAGGAVPASGVGGTGATGVDTWRRSDNSQNTLASPPTTCKDSSPVIGHDHQ